MGTSPTTQSASTSGAAKDDVVGLNGDYNFTIADLLANDPGSAAKANLATQFFFGNIKDYTAGQLKNGVPTIAAQVNYLAEHGITAHLSADGNSFVSLDINPTTGSDFQYMVQMGNKGTWSLADVDVVTNHAPTATAHEGYVYEVGTYSGTVKATDVDGDVLKYSLKGPAPQGLTFNSDGTYSFDASGPAYQSLAAGDKMDVKVDYIVDDGHGGTAISTLTIHLTGTNDAAVITGDASGDFNETDSAVIYTEKLDVTDVDHGQSAFKVMTNVDGDHGYGKFSISADGTWTYTMNNAHDEFAAGHNYTDSTTVQTVDGTTQVISVTIHGTNDAPVTAPATAAVNEDHIATGSVTGSDVDDSAVLTYASVGTVPAGLTFNGDGSWSFDASDQAYQHLATGEELQVVANYVVTDEHRASSQPSTLTIKVTGTNDAPVAQDVTGSISEDGSPIKVSPVFTDVDTNDSHTFLLDTTGTTGKVVINNDGTFSYDANGKFESLAVGEDATDTFKYTVDDHHGGTDTKTVTVTIHGENDAPTATAIATGVGEDGPVVKLTADYKDADTIDTHTFSTDTTGTVGKVTNNGDGTFSYDTNGKFNFLSVGDTATDTFKYTVDDGHGGTVTQTATVTINGMNDAPTAQSWTVNASETDSKVHDKAFTDVLKIDLLGNHVSDVDQHDSLSVVRGSVKFAGGSLPSWMSLDSDGHTLSVNLNSADLDYLKAGDHLLNDITYTANDNHGGSVDNVMHLDIVGTADLQHDQTVSQTFTKANQSSSGNNNETSELFHFDFAVSPNASNGKMTLVAQGDFDGKNESAIVLSGELADANGNVEGLLKLAGDLNNSVDKGADDGYPHDNITLRGKADVLNVAYADGHVTFDVAVSNDVGSGSTISASIAYDYWA